MRYMVEEYGDTIITFLLCAGVLRFLNFVLLSIAN